MTKTITRLTHTLLNTMETIMVMEGMEEVMEDMVVDMEDMEAMLGMEGAMDIKCFLLFCCLLFLVCELTDFYN